MRRPGKRGLTLVELLVTMAVASLVLMSVVASGVTMMQYTQGQGRRTRAETVLALALSQIERRTTNAGVGYANSRFAVRIHNNVTGTVPNYGPNGTTPVVARGDANPGIVEDTDILELSMAASGVRRMGTVVKEAVGNDVIIGTADPFLDSEIALGSPKGQLMMFSDPEFPEDSCQATLQSATFGPEGLTLTVNFVDDDLGGGGWACAVGSGRPNEGAPCPCRPGMDVYALEQRLRIVVYQQANGQDMGLYLQDQDPANPGAFLGTFTPLAVGVENMQVAPTVGARVDGSSLPVGGCTATGITAGAPNWNPCVCNLGPADVCKRGVGAPGPEDAYVRSVMVELMARAERREGGIMPASLDGTPGAAPDNADHVTARTSIPIKNPFLPLR